MARFVCKNCGFRTGNNAGKCPYCDRNELVREQTAEELLEDVE